MFLINDVPGQIDPALIALLRQAEPATIGHFRHVGFMDPGVRSLLSGHRIAGTAVTVRCFGPDTAIVHYAVGKLRPGDVLVIDRAGDMRHAACGGGVAFAAREAAASASSLTARPPGRGSGALGDYQKLYTDVPSLCAAFRDMEYRVISQRGVALHTLVRAAWHAATAAQLPFPPPR
jgi:hypothetical protein